MAGSLIPTSQSTLTSNQQKLATLLARGYTHTELAKKLGKGNPAAEKRWRQKLRRLATHPEVAQMVVNEAKGTMILGLAPASEALVKRANRGRTDAIKLLFEATGFHNPKVQHEHSGDIQIHIKSMPRPQAVENDNVVDAEVVE